MTRVAENLPHGFRACRTWETQPNGSEGILWSVDAKDGMIQGPLDFQFLRGRKILLKLDPGQIGLLVRDGTLQAVFLEGAHPLSIGTGDQQVHPDSELLFLAADRLLTVTWSEGSDLWLDEDGTRPTRLAIAGRCRCRVHGPSRFYAAFLRFSEDIGEPFAVRIVDSVVRSRLGKVLGGIAPGPGSGDPESRLSRLGPADLDPVLEELGLRCTELEVRPSRSREDRVPVTAGQAVTDRVNRS